MFPWWSVTQLYFNISKVASPQLLYTLFKLKSTPTTAENSMLYRLWVVVILLSYILYYCKKNDACKCPSDIQLACRVPALRMCSYYLSWWPFINFLSIWWQIMISINKNLMCQKVSFNWFIDNKQSKCSSISLSYNLNSMHKLCVNHQNNINP